MAMTKQDFIRLADYLQDTTQYCEPFTERQLEHLANYCHATNPLFNRQRWLDYIASKPDENGGRSK